MKISCYKLKKKKQASKIVIKPRWEWETSVDFAKIEKDGIKIEKLLSKL